MTDLADLIARVRSRCRCDTKTCQAADYCSDDLAMIDAIEALVAERDEALALLQEARGYVAYWQYSGDSEHAHRFTRIDAVLAKTGRTG